MAKGDQTGSSGSSGTAPQQPKVDQYHVMNRMMDMFHNNGNGIAPSQNFQQRPNFGTGQNSLPRYQAPSGGMSPNNWGITGGANNGAQLGNIGSQVLQTPQDSPVAPTNTEDLIRRSMTGAQTYGNDGISINASAQPNVPVTQNNGPMTLTNFLASPGATQLDPGKFTNSTGNIWDANGNPIAPTVDPNKRMFM